MFLFITNHCFPIEGNFLTVITQFLYLRYFPCFQIWKLTMVSWIWSTTHRPPKDVHAKFTTCFLKYGWLPYWSCFLCLRNGPKISSKLIISAQICTFILLSRHSKTCILMFTAEWVRKRGENRLSGLKQQTHSQKKRWTHDNSHQYRRSRHINTQQKRGCEYWLLSELRM